MQQGTAALGLIPTPSTTNVCLVLPTQRVSWHEVQLPKTAKAKLDAVLAGVLEEQLLDDPADLHLCLVSETRVAAVDKAWLRTLVQAITGAGYSVNVIAPTMTDVAEADVPRWQGLLSARGVCVAAGTNLAVGAFAPQSRWSTRLQAVFTDFWSGQPWFWARWALVVAVLAQVIGLNVWAWRDRAELSHKREQIAAVAVQALPKGSVVIDAKLQMEKLLATLRSGSAALGARDLEVLLGQQSAPVSQVDYANNELKLKP